MMPKRMIDDTGGRLTPEIDAIRRNQEQEEYIIEHLGLRGSDVSWKFEGDYLLTQLPWSDKWKKYPIAELL